MGFGMFRSPGLTELDVGLFRPNDAFICNGKVQWPGRHKHPQVEHQISKANLVQRQCLQSMECEKNLLEVEQPQRFFSEEHHLMHLVAMHSTDGRCI